MGAFESFVRDLGAIELYISSAHAVRAGALMWDHRDPFDRVLAAQSLLEHAPIITRDPAFRRLGAVEVVW